MSNHIDEVILRHEAAIGKANLRFYNSIYTPNEYGENIKKANTTLKTAIREAVKGVPDPYTNIQTINIRKVKIFKRMSEAWNEAKQAILQLLGDK